jgi:hypothetical protein
MYKIVNYMEKNSQCIRVQKLKIIGLKMAKTQGSDGRIDKCKTTSAILNIDFILF